MKMQIWLLTLFLAASVFAEDAPPFDLTTLSGKKYLGVTVTRVEGDAIAISHADGIARVAFADLPPELRTKYGYDPNKAAAAIAQRADAMARQRAIDAKNMEAEKQLKAAPLLQAEKEQKARIEAVAKAPKILRDKQGQIVSATASEIAANAFTLENCVVRLALGPVRGPKIQEVEAGVFEVELRDMAGGSKEISGNATREQAAWLENVCLPGGGSWESSLFVLISEPNKYGTKVKFLGNTQTGGGFGWKFPPR